MKHEIRTFVAECDIFQRKKGEIVKTSRASQLLLVPTTIWTDISMDFILALLKSNNKLVIMVVINFLSRYAHFCALLHPFTPSTIAQVFMDRFFKLHGIPTSILLDSDPTFTNKFW